MPSITLKVKNIYGSYEEYEISLQEWRFGRRSVRSKLEYKNGGGESVYHGFTYFLELRFQFIDTTDYANIVAAIDAIRSERTVQWLDADGLNYLGINFGTADAMYLDIEQDEIVEAQGEWFEKMPFEITFIVTRAVTGAHDDA